MSKRFHDARKIMASTTVSVKSLTKSFGHFTAIDSVSFNVYAGEIFGFLGPNGAGKSTTIRILCGILRPTSGDATILGYSAFTQQEMIRQSIGYMSQRFSLYDDLTVRENLQFFGSLYGIGGNVLRKRILEAIELSGIGASADSLTKDLPAGIKQRLALGAATMHHPEILFLDEPTSGVDPATRQNFWKLPGCVVHGCSIPRTCPNVPGGIMAFRIALIRGVFLKRLARHGATVNRRVSG